MMNSHPKIAATLPLSSHQPERTGAVSPLNSYDRDTFARMSFWYEGELVCGGCDHPIVDARCHRCEIVFHGDKPAEPIPTFSERRQAYRDSSVYLSEVRQARHFGRQGVSA